MAAWIAAVAAVSYDTAQMTDVGPRRSSLDSTAVICREVTTSKEGWQSHMEHATVCHLRGQAASRRHFSQKARSAKSIRWPFEVPIRCRQQASVARSSPDDAGGGPEGLQAGLSIVAFQVSIR